VATAKAVVAAGFPVVATTSGGVAATLGYGDGEGAPAEEMLAADGYRLVINARVGYQAGIAASSAPGSALRSSLRELIPSFGNTLCR
jgi:hypothetical protein